MSVFWWKMQQVCSLCIGTSFAGLCSFGKLKRWDWLTENASFFRMFLFMKVTSSICDGQSFLFELVKMGWFIWNCSFFGSVHDLAARISKTCQNPQLPWSIIIPHMFLAAWNRFLKVVFNFKSTYREKDRAIFEVLPLFHNPHVRLPFRLITPEEAACIFGISHSFAHAVFPSLKVNFSFFQQLATHFIQL